MPEDARGGGFGPGGVDERRAAILALKGYCRPECLEPLVNGLADRSWRVRKTAQEILFEDYRPEDYIPKLIELLYLEHNAGARNAAIETLTRLGRKATPRLMEAFKTENADVRKFVIDILGELRDKRALSVMLGALNDEDENVRASAVEHLGKLGEASVVRSLVEIVENGDIWTAYPATDALGRIGDKRAIPALVRALRERKPLREPALKALAVLGDGQTVKEIAPFLRDTSRVVQEESLKAIERLYNRGASEAGIADALKGALGDDAVLILINQAWNPKPDVRIPAILLLGLLKDERALESLFELSQETEFAEDAARALVFIGKERPEALLPFLKNEDPYLKRFITKVAGVVADRLYYAELIKLLKDEDGHVRGLAARGLADIGDTAAVESLKGLLADEYPDVQEAGVEALQKLGGGLELREVIGWTESKDGIKRKNAVLLLGRLFPAGKAPSEVAGALGFALKDELPEVRKAAISALSSIGTKEAFRHLLPALTDEDPSIRAGAALSMGSAAEAEFSEPLSLLLADSEDMVRAAAVRALGRLGLKENIPALLKTLSDRNGFVVAAAINALGKIGGIEAESALVGMLSSDDIEIRRTAIRALSGFAAACVHVSPFLSDPDWATRMAAVHVLASCPEGKGELERLLDSEEDAVVRKAIEKVLGA